jgi:hypothetical protein
MGVTKARLPKAKFGSTEALHNVKKVSDRLLGLTDDDLNLRSNQISTLERASLTDFICFPHCA